ncbi:sugar ABC transporter substrate-binding protein [bacterium C-53]|nr:sugar ABC transporter substrate-binding protein [Lachnospiraceae bacterium]NBI03179.1 sugar ABC transporter substrate-binding protein [Lachnospiraceae bacterium]RKJ10070.1 sugar ABC transporter substrate-binding protein [bacterium C-53]
MNGLKKILLLTGIAVCLSGCAERAQEETPVMQNKEADAPQIGITFDSFVIERWQRDRDVFVATVNELGAQVNVQNANGSVEEQKSQIQYFIDKKVDVIVVVAVDSSALVEEVEQAHRAGIKVIAYDRLLLCSGADLYISFDNEMVGTLMGRTIAEQMPEGGKVIKIGGPVKDNNVKLVEQGFLKEISGKKLDILASFNASEWKGEEAFNYLNSHVRELYQAGAIMCGNDCLASQAIRALSERRLAGKVIVVGQDADLDACQRIVEGTQNMTVYKPIERLAKQAAQCAVALAEGREPVQEEGIRLETIEDGMQVIPYVKIAPERVTKDNIDTLIIGSGFHLREDVYANVPR